MTVQDKITASAGAAGIDPALALAVAHRESGFDQSVRGAAGEIGVFQLMPATAAGLGVDPYDLDGNIAGGVRYLAQQLSAFGGDPFKAVAAYNAGPNRVGDAVQQFGADWFAHIPSSTQGYVTDIMANQPGVVTYSAGFPAITSQTIQPLALGVGLAAALLALYSYAASESNPPEWEDFL